MRTRGAILKKAPGKFEVVDLELDEPRQGELQVKMVATGLCHSDDHITTGDMPVGIYPMCGGHEGSGIVEKVGPNTPGYEVGDHVVFSFLPGCGRCRWCAMGKSNLCDLGALLLAGSRFDDPTSYRMHLPDGTPVGQMCAISTFAEHTVVGVDSAVKVDKDLPLDKLCLLGCGIGTGWGAAVNSANVQVGDTVIVMGVGGIGINAIQGAAHAGANHIIAVDPVKMKQEKALELGATHSFSTIEEADAFAKSVTNGQGANSCIITVGIMKGEYVGQAFSAIGKTGTVVITALGDFTEVGMPVSLIEMVLYQKRIQGSLYGACAPRNDILKQVDMYRSGKLKLDELITTTYSLDELPKGYEDMHAGKNIRGVVLFD